MPTGVAHDRQGDDEEIVAHDWLERVYQPLVRRIPSSLRAKLEPAEVFHEVLEHRWYMAERARHDFTIRKRSTTAWRTRSCRASLMSSRLSASTRSRCTVTVLDD